MSLKLRKLSKDKCLSHNWNIGNPCTVSLDKNLFKSNFLTQDLWPKYCESISAFDHRASKKEQWYMYLPNNMHTMQSSFHTPKIIDLSITYKTYHAYRAKKKKNNHQNLKLTYEPWKRGKCQMSDETWYQTDKNI